MVAIGSGFPIAFWKGRGPICPLLFIPQRFYLPIDVFPMSRGPFGGM